MREFFVQLPRPLADAVKAARRRFGGHDFVRAFAAGLDLARRSQAWDTARQRYKDEKRVTVRFVLPDEDYDEIQRLRSFFARARWEIAAAGVHYALGDNAGNVIAFVVRSAPRPSGDRAAARAARGARGLPGAGLLALAPKRRAEGLSFRASAVAKPAAAGERGSDAPARARHGLGPQGGRLLRQPHRRGDGAVCRRARLHPRF